MDHSRRVLRRTAGGEMRCSRLAVLLSKLDFLRVPQTYKWLIKRGFPLP